MILDYEYPVVYFNGDDYEDSDVINKAGQIELLQISQEPYEAIVNAEGYSFHILFGSKTGETSCAFRAGAWDVSCHT